MSGDTRKPHVDADGVRVFETNDGGMAPARLVVGLLVTAAVIVVALTAGAVALLRRAPSGGPPEGPAVAAAPAVAPSRAPARHPVTAVRAEALVPAPAGPAARPPGHRAPTANPVANPPAVPPAHEQPADAVAAERDQRHVESMARDVIEGLKASGETRGLAAFPPPGTNPIKTGLVVPDDFELPEGYVRHYQTTDDGKRLEAILMFSPDYKFMDADGQPVALPDDGIVPPDMAPPGLPLRTLEIPKSPRTAAGAGASGR